MTKVLSITCSRTASIHHVLRLYLFNLLCVLSVTGCIWGGTAAYASEPKELFRAPISYRGPDGMYLTIQEYKQDDSLKALVTLEEHPKLGSVQSYISKVVEDGRSVRYVTEFQSPALLIAEKRIFRSGKVEMRVPRLSKKGWYLFTYPSTEEEKNRMTRDAEGFRRSYFYHRKALKSSSLAEVNPLFKRSCKSNLTIDFKPESFSASTKESYALEAMCADVLLGAMGVCMDDVGRQAIQTSLQEISCVPGDLFSVKLDNNSLVVQLAPGTGEISSRVHTYLLDTL